MAFSRRSFLVWIVEGPALIRGDVLRGGALIGEALRACTLRSKAFRGEAFWRPSNGDGLRGEVTSFGTRLTDEKYSWASL
jgi:hypothetical protein